MIAFQKVLCEIKLLEMEKTPPHEQEFHSLILYYGIMYSQIGVGPLLYLCCPSLEPLLYIFCPLLFISCTPALPLEYLLYLSCSFNVHQLFLRLSPEDIEKISRCLLEAHSCPPLDPLSHIK